MKELIKILHEGNYSCIIKNNEKIRTFSKNGIQDIYELIEYEPDFLKGASIADKIIGKSAAALLILGGVKEIYGDIISYPALELLQKSGINPDFGLVVPFIKNRDQTDWCPLEKICFREEAVEAIFPLIQDFILNMRMKNNNSFH